MKEHNLPILVICGPTSSGKTSLAISTADIIIRNNLSHKVNILSADSRQIYSGLDITTGKDIPSNLSPNITIYGINLVRPDETYNLIEFKEYANSLIKQSIEKGIPLIIVGGTGLYIKAITSNFLNVRVPPHQQLRQELGLLSVTQLQQKLSFVNPNRLSAMNHSDANNPRRLIRAIEIAQFSDDTKTPINTLSAPKNQPKFIFIGIRVSKINLQKNIYQRVITRIQNGALEEVKKLINLYPSHTTPIFSSLGIRDIKLHLKGELSIAELINRWSAAEVDYARRQMVWFNKQSDIVWYDKSKLTRDFIKNLIKKIYSYDKKKTYNL